MPRKPLTQEEMQKICDDWNAKHPVGTSVVINRGNDEFHTRTRSGADILNGFPSPIIYVEGMTGCYPLDWVQFPKEVHHVGR